MVSPLLVKAAPKGREIVNVTPERAGWTYVGFRALRLATGETESLNTGDKELCLVVLSGTVDVTVQGQRFAGLGASPRAALPGWVCATVCLTTSRRLLFMCRRARP